MTTATATTWPTMAELERVGRQLVDAFNALEELHLHAFYAFNRDVLQQEEFDLIPSLEEIGEVTRFLVFAKHDVRQMGEWLQEIERIRDQAAWSWLTEEDIERRELRAKLRTALAEDTSSAEQREEVGA